MPTYIRNKNFHQYSYGFQNFQVFEQDIIGSLLKGKGNSRQSERPFVLDLFSDLGLDHSRVNLELR